ncbi:DNA recombination protein RmuC [Nitrosophilus kaiyonis]|uniref:DNA recombination protein RmuC n=1 Tax=Nitrosophilus kaiyonis TaxID=2930200 RepID=UPI00248FCBDC|nr:DNA recombination protein RmuC [Nitrosophilus kaiyonis]
MLIIEMLLGVLIISVLLTFIFLKKEINKFKINEELLTKNFYEFGEKLSKNFEEQKNFLHQKLEKIDEKLFLNAKENQEQITKNIELFNKIEKGISDFKNDMKSSLDKHFYEFSNALKNQSEKLNQDFISLNNGIEKTLKESFEKNNQILQEIMDKNSKLFIDSLNSQKDFKDEISKALKVNFEELNSKVSSNLEKISNKVDERLKEGFENVDKTFKDIITGIAKIAEAQKNIENLSREVVSLQNVLSDKKSRGIFGEVQLNSILKSIFGENRELYDIQYPLKDEGEKVIADAVIKAPEPIGLVAIDSKFPLENYTKMIESNSENDKKRYEREFKQNLKKHINDISSKYIIKGKTADMAILFLPAEAIFAEINAYHQDIIDYARKNSVWIASPTTLMALLTTVQAIVRDVKTQEQAKRIQEELRKLSKNFKLYKERWEKLARHIDTVNKDVKDIHVTTKKISDEFEKIEKVEFEEKSLLE